MPYSDSLFLLFFIHIFVLLIFLFCFSYFLFIPICLLKRLTFLNLLVLLSCEEANYKHQCPPGQCPKYLEMMATVQINAEKGHKTVTSIYLFKNMREQDTIC